MAEDHGMSARQVTADELKGAWRKLDIDFGSIRLFYIVNNI